MNKRIPAALLAALLLTMTSCGGDGGEAASADPAAQSAEAADTAEETAAGVSISEDGYVCTLDSGKTIPLGAKTDDILGGLGAVTDTQEAPSCLYDGTDKVYTIDGAYTVTSTQAADGQERITQISFLSDASAVKTDAGMLMIGSDEADVTAAFGEPAEDSFGIRKYNLTGGTVTVVITDGLVTGLTFAY